MMSSCKASWFRCKARIGKGISNMEQDRWPLRDVGTVRETDRRKLLPGIDTAIVLAKIFVSLPADGDKLKFGPGFSKSCLDRQRTGKFPSIQTIAGHCSRFHVV